MVIMGYVQVRLKYSDVFQPAHKTDSTSLLISNMTTIEEATICCTYRGAISPCSNAYSGGSDDSARLFGLFLMI
jgi:hypothetical protein